MKITRRQLIEMIQDNIGESSLINEGIGAILRPIMSSTPTKTNTDQTVLQSVDCVGAYPKPGEY